MLKHLSVVDALHHHNRLRIGIIDLCLIVVAHPVLPIVSAAIAVFSISIKAVFAARFQGMNLPYASIVLRGVDVLQKLVRLAIVYLRFLFKLVLESTVFEFRIELLLKLNVVGIIQIIILVLMPFSNLDLLRANAIRAFVVLELLIRQLALRDKF